MNDEYATDVDPPQGGRGAETDKRRRIHDTRMMERALRERWDIPAELRGDVVKRLALIVRCGDASHREATAASQALLQASRVNLEAVSAGIRAQEHDEVMDRLAELERRAAQATGKRP